MKIIGNLMASAAVFLQSSSVHHASTRFGRVSPTNAQDGVVDTPEKEFEEIGELVRLEAYPGEIAALEAMPISFLNSKLATPPDMPHPFWMWEWDHVLKWQVVKCSAVLFLAGLLCSAGGIGGGGIYVTVLMIAGGLTPRDAVPLSKAIVFFGSLSSLVLNLRKTLNGGDSSSEPKKVIDYNICRIVVPSALIGTLLGVLLNHSAADHVIVLGLCGFLLVMSAMVLWTTWSQYAEEEAETAKKAAAHDSVGDMEDAKETSQLPSTHTPSEANLEGTIGSKAMQDQVLLDCSTLCKKQSASKPQDAYLGILMLIVVVSCGVFRYHTGACLWELQSKGNTLGRDACHHPVLSVMVGNHMETWMSNPSYAAWAMFFLLAIPVSACSLVMLYFSRECIKHGGWTASQVAKYEIMGVVTGCLAGLVGIGGGLIFAPFFLIMGVDPSVAVATSSTCVIFTSSSTTMQYLLTDRIIISLTGAYGLCNLLASWGGTAFVHFLQDNFTTRKSYISAIVAVGVVISAVLAFAKLFEVSTSGPTSSGVTHVA